MENLSKLKVIQFNDAANIIRRCMMRRLANKMENECCLPKINKSELQERRDAWKLNVWRNYIQACGEGGVSKDAVDLLDMYVPKWREYPLSSTA